MADRAERDDDDLLSAWQSGDSVAGEALVRRHYPSIYRFFANKAPRDADDLTQRTFTDLQRAVNRVRSSTGLRAYLMRIARNNLYMDLRKRIAKERTFDPEVDAGDGGIDDRTPSRLLAGKAEEKLLLAALRRIPIAAQVVLELYYWESMSTKEIAEAVDVAPGTVMSRLSRARNRLRETIERLETDSQTIETTLAGLETWASNIRAQANPES